jgi:NADH:ubiquinone oxidoreductase subunit F (NADH-binding)
VSDDTEQRKEVNKMLTKNEQKTLERLETVMQSMDEMQKAQLCAFAEGLAMALEHSKRAS